MGEYQFLDVVVDSGIARVTINNPPINLMTEELFAEFVALVDECARDDRVRVVVVRSGVEGFFVAHFDVEALLAAATDERASGAVLPPLRLGRFHVMCERLRTMPMVTIACIDGRVGGAGSELALAMDMRFGALGTTVVNQMEVAAGIIAGGGGTQRLPVLLGRGRALEVLLGCDDLDAATAERWGYLNRALPPGELEPYVDRLARRIASFPPHAVALTKQAVLASGGPPAEGLLTETRLYLEARSHPDARRALRALLDAGAQTPEGERRMGELCAEANAVPPAGA